MVASALAAENDREKVSKKLENVEQEIEQSKTRAAELTRRSAQITDELAALRQQLIETAASTQEQEQEITNLEASLPTLNAMAAKKTKALEGRRAQLAATLAALERIAIYPPEALIALPETPTDTVRSALLLQTAIPAVEARAQELRDELDSLRNLREQIARHRQSLIEAKGRLDSDHQRLAALLDRKNQFLRETEAGRQSAEDRIARLAAQAKDLHDLMDRIEAERARREVMARIKPVPPPPPSSPTLPPSSAQSSLPPTASTPPRGGNALAFLSLEQFPTAKRPQIRPISQARGLLALPAQGDILKQFGSNEEAGTTSRGLTIRTRPDAQVVAPYDGQVVFAGPFRGYGQILIIEHSEGYHTVLSGLSRIDVAAGQWVLAGEPVGIMGRHEGGAPELYVELRRNGRPINPMPWLALHNGKVNG